jgi:putative ABC transport system ATP-binding protein
VITSTDQPLARCRDVSRTYGRGEGAVVAVHGSSCDIVPGDRIAIVGSSGSGKSTFLHMLAGLEPATTGSVTWPALDQAPTLNPGIIGVVFQGPSLIPALDVTENVALPLILAGTDDATATTRAGAALRSLAIEDLGCKLPEELSGGQAQRVAIARVLAARPRLVLADEPTGQLDGATAAHVMDVLIAAVDDLEAALVISTHDPKIAARMHQQWSMRSGRLMPQPSTSGATSEQVSA